MQVSGPELVSQRVKSDLNCESFLIAKQKCECTIHITIVKLTAHLKINLSALWDRALDSISNEPWHGTAPTWWQFINLSFHSLPLDNSLVHSRSIPDYRGWWTQRIQPGWTLVRNRVWVWVPFVTLVSLSKTLNHDCFISWVGSAFCLPARLLMDDTQAYIHMNCRGGKGVAGNHMLLTAAPVQNSWL